MGALSFVREHYAKQLFYGIIDIMSENSQKQGVFKPVGRRVWPHEDRVAEILASAGHYVEFLPEGKLHSADILLDGVEYELKSPRSPKPNSMEQLIKDALYKKQCPNIVFDSLRLKGVRENEICNFLISQVKKRKKIENLLFVTRRGKNTGRIIDIFTLV